VERGEDREVWSLPFPLVGFVDWSAGCCSGEGGSVLGDSRMRFHIAPPSLEEAVIEAAQEGHGLIVAMGTTFLFGVQGLPLGKVAGLWNVEFSEEQVWEMLENRNVGVPL
jgi:hypothetical protein